MSYEDVLTGPGLINLYRFVHETSPTECDVLTTAASTADAEPAAAIAVSALEGRCERCVEALEMFISALGAEAGNLGLRSLATGGVYLGGGIPRMGVFPLLKSLLPVVVAFLLPTTDTLDHRRVGNGTHRHGLFQEPMEELPAMA